jgi:hypothetical protein
MIFRSGKMVSIYSESAKKVLQPQYKKNIFLENNGLRNIAKHFKNRDVLAKKHQPNYFTFKLPANTFFKN